MGPDAGLLWVEARIRELAAELGQPVDCLEWPRRRPAVGPLPLKVRRGGEYRVLEFSREELLEVEGVSKTAERRNRHGRQLGQVHGE